MDTKIQSVAKKKKKDSDGRGYLCIIDNYIKQKKNRNFEYFQ